MRFEEDLAELPHTARAKVSAQELKLADQLISSLAGDWNPGAFHDDYVPALMKVIKAKAAGKKLPAVSEKPTPPTKVVDLVERLRESLAAAQRDSRGRSSRRASTTSAEKKRASTSPASASRRQGRRGRRPAA
jgi:DNA end-binding protein Ku